MSDIAIAHDQFYTMGGAERVACEIARTFDAPIYAMRVDDDVPPDDVDVRELATKKGRWLMRRHFLFQDAYQMVAWQHVDELYEYDTIIQTKNNPAWFVPHADSQTVIRYTHSTPRSMFDQFHRRGGDVIGDMMKTVMRILYQQTTPYADHWVCNSEIVKRRVKTYADPSDADIEVIHPPVKTHKTSPERKPTEDYYFTVGRLAVNKRIDLLKDVAKQIDERIVVAGDGPYKDELSTDKPDNLEYIGYVSESEKWDRLSEAKATLFLAENEDFGIVPIESMAAGTPVIGVNEGNTQYQIQDGKNGYLATPTAEAVTNAISLFDANGVNWSDAQIAEFAEQFSVERFRTDMQRTVERVVNRATIQPNVKLPTEINDD